MLYLAGIFPAAVFWYRVLVRAGQEVKFGEAIRAYYISQLGKYVPGKWMVILLRRALLHSPTAENTVVAAAVFFETFTMLAVGAAMSALVLIAWHPEQKLLIAAAVGSTILLGVPSVPSVFEWLIRVLGVGKLNPTAGAKLRRVGLRAIVIGWITISIGWLLQGMSLWATLRSMDAATGGPFHDLSLHTTAVALGVVAGFISQVPGGLGMRELVSAELMQAQYGESVALVSAIIFRLVLLVSELVISIILYAVGWRRPRKPAAVVEAELTASANR
jgi:glycosyltransferase 2 family protein